MFEVQASDDAGGTTTDDPQASVTTIGDPASVAPPNDPTIATDFSDSVRFLYEGPNALQLGVAPVAVP